MMTTVGNNQQGRIHPHKFTLWVAMGSIVMMFAGLTSAYIVRSNQANWLQFDLPVIFWYSTAVILASSITMQVSVRSFKAREMKSYRRFISITALLGVVFALLQILGFRYLHNHGIPLIGSGSNPSASFLGVIAGIHALHVLGGVIALLVVFIRAHSTRIRTYSPVTVEIVSTYWHFVDILWIYLFIFFSLMH